MPREDKLNIVPRFYFYKVFSQIGDGCGISIPHYIMIVIFYFLLAIASFYATIHMRLLLAPANARVTINRNVSILFWVVALIVTYLIYQRWQYDMTGFLFAMIMPAFMLAGWYAYLKFSFAEEIKGARRIALIITNSIATLVVLIQQIAIFPLIGASGHYQKLGASDESVADLLFGLILIGIIIPSLILLPTSYFLNKGTVSDLVSTDEQQANKSNFKQSLKKFYLAAGICIVIVGFIVSSVLNNVLK